MLHPPGVGRGDKDFHLCGRGLRGEEVRLALWKVHLDCPVKEGLKGWDLRQWLVMRSDMTG